MSTFEQSYPLGRLRKAGKEELETTICHQGSAPLLFPHGLVFIESRPMHPIEPNCDLIWDMSKDVFTTVATDGLRDSLSMSTALPCQRGILYEVNYHGTDDVRTILAHVIKHLHMASQAKENKNLIVVPHATAGGTKVLLAFFQPNYLTQII